MLNLDAHNITKIVPIIHRFGNFTVLYLYLEGPKEQTKITFFLDEDNRDVPMDLLNQLGPAIENAKEY